MRYAFTTYKVRLEVSELGSKTLNSEDAARVAKAIYQDLDADKEHFVMLALNTKHRVVGFKVISTGSMTTACVSPREVFRAALALAAVRIICIHNHPSGDPMPSQEDFELTKRIRECGEMMDVRILDHIILGADRIYSFSDKGVL